jgi:hypothetical protein
MPKNKNSGQRTPQPEKTRDDPHRKKHQGSTPRPIYGTTSVPSHRESNITPIPTTVELPLETTQAITVVPSAEDIQRTLFTTPHQTAPIVDNTVPPRAPNRERELHAEMDILAVEEDAPDYSKVWQFFLVSFYKSKLKIKRLKKKPSLQKSRVGNQSVNLLVA